MITFIYDKAVDAAYVRLRKGKVVRTKRLDDSRLIDYGSDGEPLGVELLNVKASGVDTRDLPARTEIERILHRRKLKVLV